MLAIWGLPIGLLIAGPLIELWGFSQVAWTYSAVGLVLTLAMTVHWRQDLWSRNSSSNQRVEAP